MATEESSAEQSRVAWQALQAWLSRDEEGQTLLNRLQADPQGAAADLAHWLRARLVQTPLQLATYITGGQVENLVNIAQAGAVLLTLPPVPTSALHQLPPDIADFTGRQKQLHKVMALLTRATEGRGTAVIISAMAGMPGVGKSALAIHAAHHLKTQFPDAQLYVNLRGAEGQPLAPFDVLAGFLQALGVEEPFMPKELEWRSVLYRSMLSDKRALVLLDNALDEAQVRPLLPGGLACAALVTSRQRLSALEGAALLHVPVMTERESLALLQRIIGAKRMRAERQAAMTICDRCGYLPLAVRIAGAKLRKREHWTLAQYAQRLTDERQRLEELCLGDLEVRASFLLSYRDLASIDSRLFRLLGLVTGPTFGPELAAALKGSEPHVAREALERLADAQLLEPAGGSRYRFHDLVRLFARERLAQEEVAEAQDAARRRGFLYCLRALLAANRRLDPDFRRRDAEALAARTNQRREEVEHALLHSTLAFLEAERANLVVAVEWAYLAGAWDLVYLLAMNLVSFFEVHAHWADWRHTHELALNATRNSGDHLREAQTLRTLGRVYDRQGRWADAVAIYEASLRICRDIGDRPGEARTLSSLGLVLAEQGHWEQAVQNYHEALETFRGLGDRDGEAVVLLNLGRVFAAGARWKDALEKYHEALAIFVALGDRGRKGHALSLMNAGFAYLEQRLEAAAIQFFEKALDMFKTLGDRHDEGRVLLGLGRVFADQGRWDEAIDILSASRDIFRARGDLKDEGVSLLGTGNVYKAQGRKADAIRYYEQALSLFKKLGDRPNEGEALRNFGLLFEEESSWDLATEKYQEALAVFQGLGHSAREADTLRDLGDVCYRQGKWLEAIKQYEKAVTIFRSLDDRPREGQVLVKALVKLGKAYHLQGRLHETTDKYREALGIFRKLEDRAGQEEVLANLGNVSHLEGRNAEAINHYEEALSISRAGGGHLGEGQLLVGLGIVYGSMCQWDKCIESFKTALSIFRVLEDRHAEGKCLMLLGFFYSKQGCQEDAVELWRQALPKLPDGSAEYNQVANWLQLPASEV